MDPNTLFRLLVGIFIIGAPLQIIRYYYLRKFRAIAVTKGLGHLLPLTGNSYMENLNTNVLQVNWRFNLVLNIIPDEMKRDADIQNIRRRLIVIYVLGAVIGLLYLWIAFLLQPSGFRFG